MLDPLYVISFLKNKEDNAMKMSNKTYDFWKKIGRYILPALTTLVLTIFKIWKLPYGIEIAATITAVDVFLNAILGFSSYNYNKELK